MKFRKKVEELIPYFDSIQITEDDFTPYLLFWQIKEEVDKEWKGLGEGIEVQDCVLSEGRKLRDIVKYIRMKFVFDDEAVEKIFKDSEIDIDTKSPDKYMYTFSVFPEENEGISDLIDNALNFIEKNKKSK